MRRLLLVTAALTIIATLTIAGSVATATSKTGRIHAIPTLPNRQITNGNITVGSTWTIYDHSLLGYSGYCTITTFGSSHIFTDDRGDAGKWSGNVTLKYTSGSLNGWSYKAKYYSSIPAFDGVMIANGLSQSVEILVSGSDPYSFGSC